VLYYSIKIKESFAVKSNMAFLKEVKKYIEKSELSIEREYRINRSLSEMIEEKDMPQLSRTQLYWDVLERITLEKAFSG